MDTIRIGFLAISENLNHAGTTYLGSILITNELGIPLEFRCTHSIKPKEIQRALYGEQLVPYIGVELCGIPLLNSIENKPELIIVQEKYLLSIRKNINMPVIFIENLPQDIPDSIKCDAHHSYPEDKDDFRAIKSNFNLLEPFERIRKSVEILRNSAEFGQNYK
jgi:hypothetical protein